MQRPSQQNALFTVLLLSSMQESQHVDLRQNNSMSWCKKQYGRAQVGLQAYLMWEQAGKPDGANFSDDARRQLEQQLQSGKSVQDLERALKGPSDQPQQQEHQPAEVTDTPLCCLHAAPCILG